MLFTDLSSERVVAVLQKVGFKINQGTPQQAAGYVIVWILNPIKLIGYFYIRPYNPYTSPDF